MREDHAAHTRVRLLYGRGRQVRRLAVSMILSRIILEVEIGGRFPEHPTGI